MKFSLQTKRQKVLFEITIYSVLFVLSFLFPICNYYYLAADDSMMVVEPQYISDFVEAYLFPIYYLIILLAFLSANKSRSRRMNVFVILLMVLADLYIEFAFGWWGGGPFHPDFAAGFWLSQLFLALLIIRTFTWSGQLDEIRLNPKAGKVFATLSVLIAVFLMLGTLGVLLGG